ncbi:hypothetical protein L1077_19340 [Pseudoalteromonas luteoviolacea]|uniref:hypothetical protein n=1 Tax=Pseudoalteromonas luteoviolacea TaxID=43657 RepID=UPI001F295FB3|nr:hypothetical protein [Pseudoalteromonas luteoviolacea]MCF6441596.1 hypothetical protein [Pseudoalteromonas luteoviolacea]
MSTLKLLSFTIFIAVMSSPAYSLQMTSPEECKITQECTDPVTPFGSGKGKGGVDKPSK